MDQFLEESSDGPLVDIDALKAACGKQGVHESISTYDSGPQSHGFKELRVWQIGMDFTVDCYRISRAFPKEEMFGLTSQLRRAASSIPMNVSEGWGRNRKLELARSADIARGSTSECETALELAIRLEYLTESDAAPLKARTQLISSMLLKLASSLRTPKPKDE